MKIKVTKTTKGATCAKGIEAKEYLAGETYDIFDDLAKVFVDNNWGEEVKKVEKKAFKNKLENKAIKKVEEDKTLEVKEVKETTKKKGKK